jgi:hypothetical protein
MTTTECLAALVGAVLGWKAGGLLNHLRSMIRTRRSEELHGISAGAVALERTRPSENHL